MPLRDCLHVFPSLLHPSSLASPTTSLNSDSRLGTWESVGILCASNSEMELSNRLARGPTRWKLDQFAREDYPYKKLNEKKKEIRVLDIASGSPGDMVECTLRTVSLKKKHPPPYETISYCWGSQGAFSTLKLNGHLTEVPSSSVAAIRCMRSPYQTRTLWIDAICINQQDKEEKSKQVTMMLSIYRLGRHNLVYLGEDDGTAERAMGAVESVMSDMREATNDFDPATIRRTLWREEPKSWFRNHSREPFVSDVDFGALVDLFERPWFR